MEFLIFAIFSKFAAPLMGPQGAPNLSFCFPSLVDSYLTQNSPPLGHLRRTNNKILIILAIFSYFCHLGALKGPLWGSLGALVSYFTLSYILGLNILQTRPAPRFFNAVLRKRKKNKVKNHKFGPFLARLFDP